ncbi:MAG: hypothetical protein FJW34_06050 [Acidobacteria bacterium]|nr:hypothetical protein [Acidobacteriota bacterium]
MLYFPQLANGAGGQFPIKRRAVRRTLVNTCVDGTTVKLADAGASSVEWELGLTGLTVEEWGRLAALLAAVEGRRAGFTFLDPTDNLLVWSEDLSQAAWVKEAGVELTPGMADPLGTARATRIANTGGTTLTLQQTLAAPGGYQYCFSLWARSAAAGDLWLFRSSGAGTVRKEFRTLRAWSRLVHSSKIQDASETVSFGLEVNAGQTAEVFGLQVEAQPGASMYKKTASRGGVYAEAFFQDDVLTLTSEGAGENSGIVRVRARVQG